MSLLRCVLVLCGVVLAFPFSFAFAQNPPSAWHPYQGGVNCIQVADANGFFNCAPGTTINLTTGAISYTTPAGAIFPFGGAVVLNTTSVTPQALGNDLVIATTPSTVAPGGPLFQGVTIRVRKSPLIPGYCRLVVVGNNSFVEFPIAVVNPATGGIFNVPNTGFDFVVTDFPGGPGGC